MKEYYNDEKRQVINEWMNYIQQARNSDCEHSRETNNFYHIYSALRVVYAWMKFWTSILATSAPQQTQLVRQVFVMMNILSKLHGGNFFNFHAYSFRPEKKRILYAFLVSVGTKKWRQELR